MKYKLHGFYQNPPQNHPIHFEKDFNNIYELTGFLERFRFTPGVYTFIIEVSEE